MADRLSLEQLLTKQAAADRAGAQSLPPGDERDVLLLRAHSCDMAAEINAWLGHQKKQAGRRHQQRGR
jgi:hypothetical protein